MVLIERYPEQDVVLVHPKHGEIRFRVTRVTASKAEVGVIAERSWQIRREDGPRFKKRRG